MTARNPSTSSKVGRRPAEDEHRAHEDDAVDGVRSAHQRRVQDARHLGDDLDADEGRQHQHGRVLQQDVAHYAFSFTTGVIATWATPSASAVGA